MSRLLTTSLFVIAFSLGASGAFADQQDTDTKMAAAKLNNKAFIALNEKHYVDAIHFLQEALKIRPDYSYAKSNLAVSYANYASTLPLIRAILFWRKAHEIQPDYILAGDELAKAEAQLKAKRLEPSPTEEDNELLKVTKQAKPETTPTDAAPKP